MRGSRIVIGLVVAALALAPAVGFAASDLSASPIGKHHSRVHQQPDRGWRTVPSTPAPSATVPVVARVERVSAVEAAVALPLVVRLPFIPPRG
ncbi:MAG TPA: hypothetical protein VMQ51_10575 [Candidatus Binatia bacterium]|nr:hypothetical protein [Candidatus Binatia bacterium]